MNNILVNYTKKYILYESFSTEIERLLKNILSDCSLQIHAITSRTKDPKSLEKKISKPDKSYSKLEEITDLSGIRIITYFEKDIEAIKEIIVNEFQIDNSKSEDKREKIHEREFSYQSHHLIISLKKPREDLTDYLKYKNLYCEIQIRTILQHAWAEIEHDIGYKNQFNLPKSLSRRFGKLSALLELADDEFGRLKLDIENYAIESANLIKTENINDLLINEIVLKEFIENDDVVADIVNEMTTIIKKAPVNPTESFWLSTIPFALETLRINSLTSLKKLLKKFQKEIVECFYIVHPILPNNNIWTSDMLLFVFILIYPVIHFTKEETDKYFYDIAIQPEDDFYYIIKKHLKI